MVNEIISFMINILGMDDDRPISEIYASLQRDLDIGGKLRQDTALGATMKTWAHLYSNSPHMAKIVHGDNFMFGAVARNDYKGDEQSISGYDPNHPMALSSDTAISDVFQAMMNYYQWRNNGTLFDIYPDYQWASPWEFSRRDNFARDHVRVWAVRKIGGVFRLRRHFLEQTNIWDRLQEASQKK